MECEVLERIQDANARMLLRIRTLLESTEGLSEFVVLAGSLGDRSL
jgi:hypothetical protein